MTQVSTLEKNVCTKTYKWNKFSKVRHNNKKKKAEFLEILGYSINVLGQLPFVSINWLANWFPTACEFHRVANLHVYPSFD